MEIPSFKREHDKHRLLKSFTRVYAALTAVFPHSAWLPRQPLQLLQTSLFIRYVTVQ